MGRKSSSVAVSKNSSASAPAMSSTKASSQRSSVLKSAFAPSQLQLRLFASVIQSFDSQQLRIHDTTTGRLRCQHETRPGTKINCLEWGYYGASYREQHSSTPKKKRKREQDPNEGAVVAYGTNTAEICIFSPSEGKTVQTLHGGHERSVLDFKFSRTDYQEGWSIGDDGKLVQWDLIKDQPIRTLSIPAGITVLASPSPNAPQILCASSTPFAIDLTSSDSFDIQRYDSLKTPIHSLYRSGPVAAGSAEFFLAADSDRYINIYDIPQRKLVRTLVAGSGLVEVDLSSPPPATPKALQRQVLCAITKDGSVELFPQPFAQQETPAGDLKSSRKNLTKKAAASVRLTSPDSSHSQYPVLAASVQGPELVLASVDSGMDLAFQKIRWQDEGNGELLFDGVKEVVKAKGVSTLNTATVNGVQDSSRTHVDESKAVVVNGGSQGVHEAETIDLSSSDGEEEEDDDDDADKENQVAVNGEVEDGESEADSEEGEEDEEMSEAADLPVAEGDADEEMGEAAEPTFGELLAAKHSGEISIAAALPQEVSTTSNAAAKGRLQLPAVSGMSLGTVLTQALRTNDQSLLESCLHVIDIGVVKNTIQRLDSGLAGVLLSKLAERLASRPGRYGQLITWVQWTCIAHGGAIAAQPDVTAKVRTLYQVLGQRTRTLDSLLLLKGKLDMLDAQLAYRKELAAQRPARRNGSDDDSGVIYIEGADQWDSDDDLDEDETLAARPTKRTKKQRKALEDLVDREETDADDDDDVMALDSVPAAEEDDDSEDDDADDDSEDEDESEEDEDTPLVNGHTNGLVDVEAEEASDAEESDPDDVTAADRGVELSSGDDDSDSSDEEEEEDDEEEEDSDLDSFINDGSISVVEDEDDVHISGDSDVEEEEEPKPKAANGKPQPEPRRSSASKFKSSKKGRKG